MCSVDESIDLLITRMHNITRTHTHREKPIFLHGCEIKSGSGLGTSLAALSGPASRKPKCLNIRYTPLSLPNQEKDEERPMKGCSFRNNLLALKFVVSYDT